MREEAAAFFKRMDEEEEELTAWRVWRELQGDSECAQLNVHSDAQLDVCAGLLDAF